MYLVNKSKKKLILIITLVLVLTLGGTFAFWTYSKTLKDQVLIAGDIYMKYTGGNTIDVKKAMPTASYDPTQYFEFEITGKNNYKKKDIVYDISLDYGATPDPKTGRTERIKDELLRFRLVEVKGNKEEELIQEGKYANLENKRIWIDRVSKDTNVEINKTYRIYMWISDETKIGNTDDADYKAEDWNKKVYASINVNVSGDFEEKELTDDYLIIHAAEENTNSEYDINKAPVTTENVKVTLGSKRKITKFVVTKTSDTIRSILNQEYPASYNEDSNAWEAEVIIDETGTYEYYAVYPNEEHSITNKFKVNIDSTNKLTPNVTITPASSNVFVGFTTTFEETSDVKGTFKNEVSDNIVTVSPTETEETISQNVTVKGKSEGTTKVKITFTPTDTKNYKKVEKEYEVIVESPTVGEAMKEKVKLNADLSTTDTDGTTYLKGDNSEVDFNYVWYSGKLWQVYAIEEDGTVKMITKNGMTTFRYNAQNNTAFKDSWAYQFLNEDFKDTLYNCQDFIETNASWDTSTEENITPSKPNGSSIEISDIGLISYYEYYKTEEIENTHTSSFIYNNYTLYTLTPKSASEVWGIQWETGPKGYTVHGNSIPIRPVIKLKSEITISGGEGTREKPYTLTGDKEIAKENEKLNTRISGEYVNFNGAKYRIVNVEDNLTKITKEDVLKDSSGDEITKLLGSLYGLGEDSTYADYYLNNDWYNSLPIGYKKMIVDNMYYTGSVGNATHKKGICLNPSDDVTIKDCEKTGVGWRGKVGLIRVGEMFSAIITEEKPNNTLWTLTPQSQTNPKKLEIGGGSSTAKLTDLCALRPTMYLDSTVYITSGNGTEESPYEIKMDGSMPTEPSSNEKLQQDTENTICKVVEDGTTYFSGSNNCVNFNYVWYSGKLWRITSVNSDGAMKMITQDAITAIQWGEDTTYKDEVSGKESWIYQWLNEDFLDTLENQENIIVQNAKWNATEDGNDIPIKPAETTSLVEGKVGLLNAYEYYQSYKKATYLNGYLNNGYFWWLITPYSDSVVRDVDVDGKFNIYSLLFNSFGARPSINLKSDIKISGGEGTKKNPYRIEGDKMVAKVNDKLNSRVSGEYVKFDNKVYRIVGIENETTKLTSVDYVRDKDNAVMIKNFGSDGLWSTSVSSNDDNYWGYYLNNTWYNSISGTYKNMLVQGTYYLGEYLWNVSYKNTICSEWNTKKTTKDCSKISSTWTGYVGLPRVGEMFSAQLGEGSSSSNDIWLIMPNSGSYVWHVDIYGNLGYFSSSMYTRGIRPSITLSPLVTIKSGKGTYDSPYEIECSSCSAASLNNQDEPEIFDNIATVGTCNNLVYNGETQALVSGGSNTSYTNNNQSEAGRYQVVAKANTGYTFSDGSKTKTLDCNISKKIIPVAFNTNTLKYNGNLQSPTATATGVKGEVIELETTKEKELGEYTTIATMKDVNSNYSLSNTVLDYTITSSDETNKIENVTKLKVNYYLMNKDMVNYSLVKSIELDAKVGEEVEGEVIKYNNYQEPKPIKIKIVKGLNVIDYYYEKES